MHVGLGVPGSVHHAAREFKPTDHTFYTFQYPRPARRARGASRTKLIPRLSSLARYLRVCPWRLRVRLHGARALANRHYLGAGAKPFARLQFGAQVCCATTDYYSY